MIRDDPNKVYFKFQLATKLAELPAQMELHSHVMSVVLGGNILMNMDVKVILLQKYRFWFVFLI